MRKSASFYFFKPKPIILENRYEQWRGVADLLCLTTHERLRVEWMLFYYTVAKGNVTLTTLSILVSQGRPFTSGSSALRALNTISLLWQGEAKVLYKKEYSEEISTWKIERVIRRHKLYPDQKKAEKITRKRARARQKPKMRVPQLVKEERPCFLFQLDTIVIYWDNFKRYILIAVDHATKLGYARMYKNKSSQVATDFLYRLRYLVNQPTQNLQTGNGSEFALEFERATTKLNIQRYFSRARTPKDNPEIERFNQTLEYEWLYNSNLSLDPEELNPRLTEWLVEYNFNRPHQSLAYLAPAEYIEKELAKIHSPVLPMWSASTYTFLTSLCMLR